MNTLERLLYEERDKNDKQADEIKELKKTVADLTELVKRNGTIE